jgi:hypothetical protein
LLILSFVAIFIAMVQSAEMERETWPGSLRERETRRDSERLGETRRERERETRRERETKNERKREEEREEGMWGGREIKGCGGLG